MNNDNDLQYIVAMILYIYVCDMALRPQKTPSQNLVLNTSSVLL